MTYVRACRICLIMDVKMYTLQGTLKKYLKTILSDNSVFRVAMPQYICYQCGWLLHKYHQFRQRCINTQTLLLQLLKENDEITINAINKLDRIKLKITNNLCIYSIASEDVHTIEYNEIEHGKVKEEPTLNPEEVLLTIDSEQNEVNSPEDVWSPNEYLTTKEGDIICKRKKRKKDDSSSKKKCRKSKRNEKIKGVEKKQNAASLTADEIATENDCTVTTLTVEEQLQEIAKRKESSNYKDSPYKCHKCFKGFLQLTTLRNHAIKHDPISGDTECPICRVRFRSRRTYSLHAVRHTKRFSCRMCAFVSVNLDQAKRHKLWHDGVTYKCQYCDEVSTKLTSHLSHIRIKHPSDFVCDVCGYSFVSEKGLKMHKSRMHKDNIATFTENESEEETIHKPSAEPVDRHGEECEALRRPRPARRAPRAYPAACEHCDEVIPSRSRHWKHYQKCHRGEQYPLAERRYICEICGKGFKGNAFLVYHKRTHSGERAYKCAQCPKAFFNRTNLQMHEKTHSDHRPYPCSVCFKAFMTQLALRRHGASHSGRRAATCPRRRATPASTELVTV